ncbi:unnamed protein product [Cladocopium goreaui]|uniref:Metalloendopeptidase n=1 Tax=Cladocopium goreaui TaxID=2562237 RepID=A0A9P1FIF0_9DINO|nr:unnamed protein product [Cladocopium goreaui]|mmetsp:Transcript_40994/g.88843  ORF Transcript_40994/g.88843 Transcript_40994/m.88843 type:complete len:136 (+) Transcript_40994:84-491(+)
MAQLAAVLRVSIAWLLAVAADPAQRNSTNLRGGSNGSAAGADSDCNSVPTWSSCMRRRCCAPGDLCYRKDAHYAQCQPEGHCSEHAGWTCKVLSPWEECQDLNSECERFKNRGECEDNPEWMLWFCRRTCGQCDL